MTLTKVNERLYVGSRNDALQLAFDNSIGITAVVNVATEEDPFIPGISCVHVAVEDGIEIPAAVFDVVLDTIREHLMAGKVLVHCVGGCSRSPLLAATYIAISEEVELDVVLARLRTMRPHIEPSAKGISSAKQYLAAHKAFRRDLKTMLRNCASRDARTVRQ